MRLVAVAAVVASIGAVATIAACLYSVPDVDDGLVTVDGSSDGSIIDSGFTDRNADAESTVDVDSSIPFEAGKPYLCGATPVADCTTDCPLLPQLCGITCKSTCALCVGSTFQCDACFSDGGASVSVCEPEDASAFASCLSGQTRCPCLNPSNCPGNSQTCTFGQCFECEEPDAGNDNQQCKNGGKCRSSAGDFGVCM